jgi:glycosyltransferase 2 family protein
MKKTWIRLAIAFGLTGLFLFFFFRSVNDWGAVLRSLTRVHWPVFLLVFPLTALHLATRAFRWRYLLIHEKRDVRFKNLFAANAVGFMVTYLLPGRLGEIVKPLYCARKEGVRPGFVLGTVVVERIFDILTVCFLLGAFLLAKPLYASRFVLKPETSARLTQMGILGLAIGTALLGLVVFFYFFRERALRLAGFVLRPLPRAWSEKAAGLLHEFIDGLKFFHSPGNLVIYVVLSFVVWLGITFFYWVFFLSYRVSIPFFFLIPYIFLTMVGASIPTPGMIGGFHAFSQFGLTQLFGLDANVAFSLTVVVHALQMVMTCLIGYAIVWREGLSLFQLRRLGETVEP